MSLFVSNNQLSSQLESFWKTEDLNDHILNKEESFCEKHFIEHTFRDDHGRFVVSLPRKENVSLGDSYSNAMHRLK